MAFESRFITPPTEQEEQYPYRRVWLSIATEMGILAALVVGVLITTRFITLPDEYRQIIGLAISLVPPALWLIFSWLREHQVEEPRRNLIAVMVISALIANAIAIPFVENVFRLNEWLPLESALNRIIGYSFTLGIVQALVVYLVLRYTVWPDNFRTRLDGVAFGASSAVGYAAVVNLHASWNAVAPPAVAAVNIFNQQAIMLCIGIIIGYGLAEVCFNPQPFPLIAAVTLALASLVTGIAVPLIAGFGSASISVSQPQGAVSPIQGFLFAIGLLFAVSVIFNFLFNVAERETAEVSADEAESLNV